MADQTDIDIQAIKPKSGLVPIILGINSVALIAVLAVVLLRGPSGGSAKSEEAPEGSVATSKVGPTLRLADFTARLHGIDTDRYARLSMEIEVPTEKERDDLSAYMPQIRDGFISYLSDCTLDDFTGSANVLKTKEKLTERLHQIVPNQKIRALYITDLVVQ
jgi:flagellar basal body-associated protein FliL